MLQMVFGIDERDVYAVLEKHWDRISNPHQRSLRQLALAIWHDMDEEDRDRFANAAMEAYLEGGEEVVGARNEFCKYLNERKWLLTAQRRECQAQDPTLSYIRGQVTERRAYVRHRS